MAKQSTTKVLGEPSIDGKIVVDRSYVTGLRAECKERRLRIVELEAEIRALRGEQGPDAGAVAAYVFAGLATAQEPEAATP